MKQSTNKRHVIYIVIMVFILGFFQKENVYYPNSPEGSGYFTYALGLSHNFCNGKLNCEEVTKQVSQEIVNKHPYFFKAFHIYDIANWVSLKPNYFTYAEFLRARDIFYSTAAALLVGIIIFISTGSFFASIFSLIIFYSGKFMEFRPTVCPEHFLLFVTLFSLLFACLAIKKRSLSLYILSITLVLISCKIKEIGVVYFMGLSAHIFFEFYRKEICLKHVIAIFSFSFLIFCLSLSFFDYFYLNNFSYSFEIKNIFNGLHTVATDHDKESGFVRKIIQGAANINLFRYNDSVRATLRFNPVLLALLIFGLIYSFISYRRMKIGFICALIFIFQIILISILTSLKLPSDTTTPEYVSNLQGVFAIFVACSIFSFFQDMRNKYAFFRRPYIFKISFVLMVTAFIIFSYREYKEMALNDSYTAGYSLHYLVPFINPAEINNDFKKVTLVGKSFQIEGQARFAKAYWSGRLVEVDFIQKIYFTLSEVPNEIFFKCLPLIVQNEVLESEKNVLQEKNYFVRARTNGGSLIVCQRPSI